MKLKPIGLWFLNSSRIWTNGFLKHWKDPTFCTIHLGEILAPTLVPSPCWMSFLLDKCYVCWWKDLNFVQGPYTYLWCFEVVKRTLGCLPWCQCKCWFTQGVVVKYTRWMLGLFSSCFFFIYQIGPLKSNGMI